MHSIIRNALFIVCFTDNWCLPIIGQLMQTKLQLQCIQSKMIPDSKNVQTFLFKLIAILATNLSILLYNYHSFPVFCKIGAFL